MTTPTPSPSSPQGIRPIPGRAEGEPWADCSVLACAPNKRCMRSDDCCTRVPLSPAGSGVEESHQQCAENVRTAARTATDLMQWEVTRLRSALENWGRHHHWCASLRDGGAVGPQGQTQEERT